MDKRSSYWRDLPGSKNYEQSQQKDSQPNIMRRAIATIGHWIGAAAFLLFGAFVLLVYLRRSSR